MNLRTLQKRRAEGKTAPKRLNISKLKKSEVKQQLTEKLENLAVHLQINDNIEDSWATFRDTVYSSAYGLVGSEIISFMKLTPHEAKTQELTDAMQ